MTDVPAHDRSQPAASRRGALTLGTALAELVLSFSLIVSIAAIACVISASVALAAPRSDLIMIEEAVGSSFTTTGILAVIAVVMGVLTVLALRDVAPVQSKRNSRRSSRR